MSETDESLESSFQQLKDDLAKENIQAFREHFFELHRYEQGQFFLETTSKERAVLYTYISPMELAEVFDILEEEEDELTSYLEEMSDEYAAEMLSEMYSDNAADLLGQLDTDEEVSNYLDYMNVEDASDIKELMDYAENTAGSIMTTEFVEIVENQTVRSALTLLKSQAEIAETIYYIYVVNKTKHLIGVLSLRDLILHEDDTLISDVLNPRVVSVNVHDDQEDVAKTFRDYDFLALPVVDQNNILLGIVTVDDIIDVIDEEAASDYSGLAAVDVDEMSENPFKAATKRLPWLITLLFLGMTTATLISHFEGLVAQASILAVFITTITGTAGNAGTQSLAVAVRRLAFKEEKKRTFLGILISEIATGMITGLVTGLTIMLVIVLWQHNSVLGIAVGTAMFVAITIANLAGSLIPMLMEKLGFDPAVASGPFISTLSDLTSVIIYFNIARLFLRYLIN